MRKTLLEPTEATIRQVRALAQIRCTRAEAAAVLNVSVRTFNYFLAHHQEAREAWEDGRQECRASLRRRVWQFAQEDPATARWLAKCILKLDAPEVSIDAKVDIKVSRAEAEARAIELLGRLGLPAPTIDRKMAQDITLAP